MIRKFSIKAKYLAMGLFAMPILAACSSEDSNGLGDYKKETITVDSLEAQSKLLTKEQYSIDSVCSLVWPSDLQYYSISGFMVKNNRAYVLVCSYETSVLVYDSSGKLLWKTGINGGVKFVSDSNGKVRKVGKKVKAEDNKYVEPAYFFVDDNDNLYATRSYGEKKIDVYNKEGNVFKTIDVKRERPNYIGVTNNGRYLFSFAENTCGAALAICNKDGRIQKKLVPFGKKISDRIVGGGFIQNGDRLCHIPYFSDSIFVFKNDTLEKVVKLDFKGKFIMDVIPDAVTDEGENGGIHNLPRFEGVDYISTYKETDSLIYFDFYYNKFRKGARLIRKNTSETFCGVEFEGLIPFYNPYLLGNKLVFFVSKDCVEGIWNRRRDAMFMEEYNKSAPQVQALIDGKIKAPAIFYISIK